MVGKQRMRFCSLGRGLLLAVLAWSASVTVPVLVSAATINVPGDFSTIQAAHNAASSGDTILVAPGTYVGQITITKAITLASHFLTTGDEGFIATTILDGGGAAYVIEIPSSAADGSTIQGFTIQNADDGITPRAKFNLLNCRVWNTKDGVDYENGSGGLVQFSTFELNGDDGLDLDNDVELLMADNIIRNNNDDGIEIRMQGYTGPTMKIEITRNQIYGNGEDGIQLIHYDVVTNRSFEITYNYIYNNTDAGIGMMDGATTKEDFRAADIPERINIFSNTFANNSHGITGGDNTVVLNNIFVNHPVIAVKNVDANSELAFNLFFGNGTDNSGSNVDVGSSVFGDPFLSAILELLPGSPAIDAGTPLYVWQGTTVLDLPPGAFSGTAPDIGAFEFDSGSGTPPDPPVLIAPPDGALDVSLTPALEWSGDGANFTVQIASDSAFGNIVDEALASTTQYTVAVGALDHLMTYFWRANASDSNGTSDFSATRSFTTEAASAPPDPPTLTSPMDGAMDVPLEPTLVWAGTADDFDVEVATDPGFLPVAFSTNTVSTTTTLPAGTLFHETDYYWHVRGRNTFGPGGFSATFIFTTVAPPDTIRPSQPLNLSSPAQTGFTIDLLWDASTDNVGVSFYNIYRDGVVVASESSTNHTSSGLTPGTSYDFQVSAVDAAGNESLLSDVLTAVTQSVSDPVMISVQVAASDDDAEERLSSGSVGLTSSDLELTREGSSKLQEVGIRFQNVTIPQAALIDEAYIQFTGDEAKSEATSLMIYGQAADDALAFASSSGNITSRDKTSEAEPWSPPPWNTVGEASVDQRTPELKRIVKKIVDRGQWQAGNAMVFIITGTGVRTAESYNGVSAAAPVLHVTYRVSVGDTPPMVTISAPADGSAFTQGDSITFSSSANDTEEGDLSANLAWVSDIDGSIGSGASFSTTTLSVGFHTITASVTDGGGLSGSDQITLTVNAPNTSPTATISAPADGSSFTEGDTVSFSGSADDTEDGDITASLSWNSSIDGALGTGGSVSTSALSVGSHTITASVTDSGGLSGSGQITLTVDPPTTDVITITKAEWRERRQELRVTATSSEQPNVVLTVEGFDQMAFKSNKYELKVRPVPRPMTVTINSSLGGSATATVVTK